MHDVTTGATRLEGLTMATIDIPVPLVISELPNLRHVDLSVCGERCQPPLWLGEVCHHLSACFSLESLRLAAENVKIWKYSLPDLSLDALPHLRYVYLSCLTCRSSFDKLPDM